MQDLGQTLKAARESKGLTLADVEEATRIRLRFLEALESGNVKSLPGRVYTEGFLRNYAIFLGLPPRELLEQLRRAHEGEAVDEPNLDAAVRPVNLPPARRSPLFVGLVLILAGLIVALGWYYLPGAGFSLPPAPIDAATATPTVPAAPAPTPTGTPVAVDLTPTPAPTAVTNATVAPSATPTAVPRVVVLVRFTALTWLRITVDGTLDFEGFMEAGSSRTWTGVREVAMVCGNAGGTEVTVDGVTRGPLGAPGQVVELAWTRP